MYQRILRWALPHCSASGQGSIGEKGWCKLFRRVPLFKVIQTFTAQTRHFNGDRLSTFWYWEASLGGRADCFGRTRPAILAESMRNAIWTQIGFLELRLLQSWVTCPSHGSAFPSVGPQGGLGPKDAVWELQSCLYALWHLVQVESGRLQTKETLGPAPLINYLCKVSALLRHNWPIKR